MTNKENVETFSRELVKRIDMQPIGEPQVTYTAPDIPDKAGFSLVQLIVTSNIVAHFVDSNQTFYLDVFSCKPFDIGTVEDTVKEFFSPSKIKINYITRHAE